MKQSWFGLTILLALAMPATLTGCASAVADGEGTNTGNGSCLPHWCSYPRQVSADDGTVYGADLSLDPNSAEEAFVFSERRFTVRGGAVQGDGVDCVQGTDQLQLVVVMPARFSTLDEQQRLHVAWNEKIPESTLLAADLTITSAREVSGTLTVSADQADGGAARVLTLRGMLSVGCEGARTVSVRLADGSDFSLDCGVESNAAALLNCNDQI